MKTTLHSCSSLQFFFPQVGVILKLDDRVLYFTIPITKHNLETANDWPHMTTLQCPWRVVVNSWLNPLKRAPSVIHVPIFRDCVCKMFVYCSYKNLKWNSIKSLTKIKMNYTNPFSHKAGYSAKEGGCFDWMHYLQVCAGCFHSLLSSRSVFSVDRSWAGQSVFSWVHLFSAF